MSTRTDRYKAAVILAQLILEQDPALDGFNLEQAFQDVRDEVEAGRRNQREMPGVARRVLELIADRHNGSRAAPERHLHVVEGDT